MKGFVTNIERETLKNRNFVKVLFTAKHHQLTVMSLKPGEDIGEETHPDLDQFTRIEQGRGIVQMGKERKRIQADSAFIIPAGVKHNVINTSKEEDLKLYTVYSSPDHEDGEVRRTKEDAE
ncbi:MAG: cupin domain-containing protein [Thermoanaerobaculia bacterium]